MGQSFPLTFIFFRRVETTNQIMNHYVQLILQHNDFPNMLATCWNVCWTIFWEMCPRDMFFSQPGPSDSLIVQYLWSGGSYSQVAWNPQIRSAPRFFCWTLIVIIKIGATYRRLRRFLNGLVVNFFVWALYPGSTLETSHSDIDQGPRPRERVQLGLT
jgi:hypothetical protein